MHGPTRSGKSHLVKYVLDLVVREEQRYRIVEVNANGQGSRRDVLSRVFFDLWLKHIGPFPADRIPEDLRAAYALACADLADVAAAIEDDAQEVTFSRTREVASSLGGEVKLVPPVLATARLTGKLDVKDVASQGWKRGRVSDARLVAEVRYELDLLGQMEPGVRTVVFVDDMDLLEEDGEEEATNLLRSLKTLADLQSAVVIATVRDRYFDGRDKDFHDFLKVDLMGTEDLRAIYRIHVNAFNGGKDVFLPEALEWLERSSAGRVGVFLHKCFVVRRAYWTRPAPIDLATLKAFVRREIARLRIDPAHAGVVAAMTDAARRGSLEVALTGDLGRSALLRLHVLTPLTTRAGFFRIDPLYAEVLREEQEEAR